MTIRLYNTLSREKEVFEPQDPNRVTMYACGPTVYNYAHIGNARPAVIFDLLQRLLRQHYETVIYARNITDVDDRINDTAASLGVPISEISIKYTEAYHQDMAAVGVELPDIEPRATDHIDQMIDMIERLVESGHAYVTQGHALFSIDSFEQYGMLSGRDANDMQAGARVEVASFKKNPGDFVLWKPSEDPQPGWDSPWGWGRPGWHLECSVMAETHLGETIDIHGGGQDLVFPHHENEIAQSMCSHGGKAFARYWMHNGFVTVDKRKMSKSVGNTMVVHELLKSHPGEAMRYLLLSAHYRQPLDWSEQELERARRTLDRLYGVLRTAHHNYGPFTANEKAGAAFVEALDDDLNTPVALAEFNRIARELARADNREDAQKAAGELLADARLIGLLQIDPDAWFGAATEDGDGAAIEALIEQRIEARANRDFAAADSIRDQLTAMGVVLEDAGGVTRWRRKDS